MEAYNIQVTLYEIFAFAMNLCWQNNKLYSSKYYIIEKSEQLIIQRRSQFDLHKFIANAKVYGMKTKIRTKNISPFSILACTNSLQMQRFLLK